MSDKNDEYRFYPEDFDGESDPTSTDFDPAPLIIVGCLGVGVALFLASPYVGPLVIFGALIELSVMAAVVFAFGLLVGSSVYFQQGKLRLGFVHVVGALGWLLLIIGTAFSNQVVLAAGGGILVVGVVLILALTWYSSAR